MLSAREQDYSPRVGTKSWSEPKKALIVFALAFVVRSVVAIVLFMTRGGTMFPDDQKYSQMLIDKYFDSTSTWDAWTTQLWSSSIGFLGPISTTFRVSGPNILIAQLHTCLAGALLSVVVYRLLNGAVQNSLSFMGGLVVALYPSQILWSSVILKDTYVALLLALLALCVSSTEKATKKLPLLVLLGSSLLVLLFLAKIRLHTLMIAQVALVLTCVRPHHFRKLLLLASVTLLFVVPLLTHGPRQTLNVLSRTTVDQSEQRYLGSINASTALVDSAATTTTVAASTGSIDSLAGSVDSSPNIQPSAAGEGLLSSVLSNIKHIPTGTRVMLLDPLPWAAMSHKEVLLAAVENVLFYPLVVLALVAFRYRACPRPHMVFAKWMLVGLVFMWGQVEGNFGTAFRHRTEFFWALVVLAMVGLDHLIKLKKSRDC